MLYIETSKIHPHPDNPRKELGDLTELAESIKEQGILQNLTVIPDGEEDYLVVIGHRRFAAAKLAGLEQVPCVISDMDHKTQVATMLLENIQRQDLTAYEQAQGFQMMMDLGASIQDISRETGLSETTVRHRIKLNELDQDMLKKKCQGEITMFDLIKLEQIKDPELKNNALAKIGTKDFDMTVNKAISDEKLKDYIDSVEDEVKLFAKKVENVDRSEYVFTERYDQWNKSEVKFPEDENHEYIYTRSGNMQLVVYRKKTAEEMKIIEKSPEDIAREEELKERYDKLCSITDAMAETRIQFIKNVSKTVLKENVDEIIAASVINATRGEYPGSIFTTILDIKMPDNLSTWTQEYKDKKAQKIAEKIEIEGALKVLAVNVFSVYEPNFNRTFYQDCVYQAHLAQKHKTMYDFLECIGYEMSSEEKQIVDGTHELYTVLPEDEDDEV